MSRDARYEQIMTQRAEQLAKSEQEDARGVAFRVAVVEVGEVQLGIPMDHLREIVPAPPAAKLPGMTGWLLGLVQIRGELMSLIDTGSVLRSTGSQRFRLVAVVESTQGPLALAVDRVIGLRDIFTDEIAETLQSRSGDEDRPIKATTKDLVSLLDVDLLASSGETTLGQLTDTARTQSLEPDGVSQPLSAPAQQDKE